MALACLAEGEEIGDAGRDEGDHEERGGEGERQLLGDGRSPCSPAQSGGRGGEEEAEQAAAGDPGDGGLEKIGLLVHQVPPAKPISSPVRSAHSQGWPVAGFTDHSEIRGSIAPLDGACPVAS
jgi:hypothetical protein